MIRLYTFLIFVAIGVTVLYAIFVLPKSDFVGKTSLLIVPVGTEVTMNMDSTVNNMVFIAQVAVDSNEDVIQNNAVVEVSRVKDHDVMELSVYAFSKKDVRSVENSVLTDIIRDLKKYYSINEDFDINIVKKESVQQTSSSVYSPYSLMIVIAVGLVAGVLALFYLLDIIKSRSEEEEKNIDGEKIFAHYNDSKQMNGDSKQMTNEIEYVAVDEGVQEKMAKEVSEEDEEFSEEILKEIKKIEDKEEMELKTNSKEIEHVDSEQVEVENTFKSAATPEGLLTTPGNLPVVDLSDFGGQNSDVKDISGTSEIADDAEPTEEELKARLNELLNGKL